VRVSNVRIVNESTRDLDGRLGEVVLPRRTITANPKNQRETLLEIRALPIRQVFVPADVHARCERRGHAAAERQGAHQ